MSSKRTKKFLEIIPVEMNKALKDELHHMGV
jgi:hypothetical protein